MLRLITSLFILVSTSAVYAQTTSGNCSPIISGSDQVIINCGDDGVKLDEPVTPEDSQFIGAIDGEYNSTGQNWVRLIGNFEEQTVSLNTGNCVVVGDLIKRKSSFLVVFRESDGICSYLKELKQGQIFARIIPLPGAMANSGRILSFFVESGQFVAEQYSGIYEG